MSLADHKNPNGTYNGVTALAELTGVDADDIQVQIDRVKANSEKLAACPYHEFDPTPVDQGVISAYRKIHRCCHCGGEVFGDAYRWHELGRRPKQTTPTSAKDNK